MLLDVLFIEMWCNFLTEFYNNQKFNFIFLLILVFHSLPANNKIFNTHNDSILFMKKSNNSSNYKNSKEEHSNSPKPHDSKSKKEEGGKPLESTVKKEVEVKPSNSKAEEVPSNVNSNILPSVKVVSPQPKVKAFKDGVDGDATRAEIMKLLNLSNFLEKGCKNPKDLSKDNDDREDGGLF
jgi:hypothetical protein